MPAMYVIVDEDGKRSPHFPEPLTFGEAESACRGEWALGNKAYMAPTPGPVPDKKEEVGA